MESTIPTVSASNDFSEEQSNDLIIPKFLNVIDEVTLFDKRDQSIYIFDSKQHLVQYIETVEEFTHSNIASISSSNEWKMINFSWLSKSEVKELSQDVKSVQNAGSWVTVASTWMYKFPFAGATVGTIGTLMQNYNQTIINAANNNQSISIYYEQKVKWNGYGPRTRIRLIRHN